MFSQFINLTLSGNGLMIAVQVSDISTFQEYYHENKENKLVTLITMKSGRTIIVDQLYEEVIRLIEEDDDEDDWDDDDVDSDTGCQVYDQ